MNTGQLDAYVVTKNGEPVGVVLRDEAKAKRYMEHLRVEAHNEGHWAVWKVSVYGS